MGTAIAVEIIAAEIHGLRNIRRMPTGDVDPPFESPLPYWPRTTGGATV